MNNTDKNSSIPPGSRTNNNKFDPHSLNQFFFGLIIIWIGLSLFLYKIDYLIYGDWLDYLFAGIGILFYVQVIAYLFGISKGHLLIGKLIAGTILIAIGASDIYGIHEWWPLILIVMGIIILSSKKVAN